MTFQQQSFGGGPEPLSMSSPEIIDLFHTLQDATRLVEGGASRLGLVDLVTVGQVQFRLIWGRQSLKNLAYLLLLSRTEL